MKLKFYLDNKNNKVYTLKNEINKKPTQEAHHKFIKIRDVKTNSSE